MVEYFRRRAVAASVVAGVVAFVGLFVLHDDATYVFDGLTSRALPLVIVSAICGIGSLILLLARRAPWARVLSMGAVATVVVELGRRAVALHPADEPEGSQTRPRRRARSTAILVVFVVAAIVILPSLGLLYVARPEEPARSRPPSRIG